MFLSSLRQILKMKWNLICPWFLDFDRSTLHHCSSRSIYLFYISFIVCLFVSVFSHTHPVTLQITTWILCLWLDYRTIRTTVYDNQTLTNSSFLHSQCLFVAVQVPVSSHLTLTPQVADTRTILLGSQHPEGVCLREFPLYYQQMPSSRLMTDANTWLFALIYVSVSMQ